MAFVHRERRKVGEVTPTTGAHVGPGAYLALVSRAGAHGYAPFASTERRTLDAGNVGLTNRTPGPGAFDAAEAAASVQERKGGAGRFGKDVRGLEAGEREPQRSSPGPADYALEADGWRSRRRIAQSGADAPTRRAFHSPAHSGDENAETATYLARGPRHLHRPRERNARVREGDDDGLGGASAATVRGDEKKNATAANAEAYADAKTGTHTKTRSCRKRDAFFTAPAIDPESLSTDPFDPAPLRAMSRGAEPTRGDMLVEAIRRRHALATRVAAAADAAAAAAAVERPDAAALRRRREAERRTRLAAVRDAYRHRDDAFVGVPGSRDARRASAGLDDADAASRFAGAVDAGEKQTSTPRDAASRVPFLGSASPPPAPPFGGSSKMGYQLAPAPSPGPGAYAEKPETFAEEVSRALGVATARRSTENRPRSTRAGVPLSAFGPADPEKKKPFLRAAARFGDERTFVPGPGAYPTRESGGEDGDVKSKKYQSGTKASAKKKGAGFGTGEGRTRVDANAVGRLVLREGRFVRADGAFDETGFDETKRGERFCAGEIFSPEAEDVAKYRYVRAGGGFAHGISDAAASARRAAAEAAAAAARRRTAFAPGARDSKADAAGPGPGAYPLPDAWAPRAAARKPATSSFRAASRAARDVAGRLGDSAESPESPPSTLRDAGRSTDAEEARLLATVERWHAFDETKNKTPQKKKGVAAGPAADSPGPGTYDVLSVLSFGDGSKEAFPKGHSSFRSASARFGSSRTFVPGPGHYEPRKPGEDMNKRSFNATLDDAPLEFRARDEERSAERFRK